MKKASAAAAVICALLLTSCSAGESVNTTDTTPPPTETSAASEASETTESASETEIAETASEAVTEITEESISSVSSETSAETVSSTETTTTSAPETATETATEATTTAATASETTTAAEQTTTAAATTALEIKNDPFRNVKLSTSYKKLTDGNPLVGAGYGADPYAMEYNGRLYVYMTNDAYEYTGKTIGKNTYSQIKSVRCISSDDMVNWTDHGVIKLAGADGACKWARVSWAPAAVRKTIGGKEQFFLYFTNGASSIGVAVSDSPTGPFTDPIGGALVNGGGGVNWVIDPAVAIDTDGTAYLCYGGGFDSDNAAHPLTARIVKLGKDMTSLDGSPAVIDAPYMFEDSGLNIIGGKYLFSYCSNWEKRSAEYGLLGEASIAYMTSDKPLSGYTYTGEVLKNPGKFFGTYGNNHHCIVEYKGKWYIFYHAQVFEKAVTGKTDGYRSTHVDEITVGGNGSIKPAKGTMSGVSQIKKFNPYTTVSATVMSNCAGVRCTADGRRLTDISDGDWIKVSGVDFGDGAAGFTAEVTGSDNGGFIRVCADKPDGDVIALAEFGSGSTVKAQSAAAVSGVHDIYIEFVGSGCELSSWSFTKQ